MPYKAKICFKKVKSGQSITFNFYRINSKKVTLYLELRNQTSCANATNAKISVRSLNILKFGGHRSAVFGAVGSFKSMVAWGRLSNKYINHAV